MNIPGISDIARLKPHQRAAFFASFLGWTLDAFDFFILIMILPAVAAEFHTSITGVTKAIFATLFLRPVGALIFGRIADLYGRRPALLIDVIFYSVIELLSGFAPSLTWLIVLRALFGIGMGGEWGVGASLAMESVPRETRGILSGILQEGYVVGFLLATALYATAFPYVGWRGMFMIGSIPSVLAIFIRSHVEESPAWIEEAERNEIKTPLLKVLRANWKLTLYVVALMTAFNFMSHGTQDLYPTFLKVQRKMDVGTTSTVVIIYNLGALFGGIFFGGISQKIGRRKAIMISSLLAIPLIPLWAYAPGTALLALGGFLIQFMVQGAWGAVPAHLNELSPTAIRGTFPGLTYQLGNLVAASCPIIQAALAERFGGDYAKALAIVVFIAILALAALAAMGREARDAEFGHA